MWLLIRIYEDVEGGKGCKAGWLEREVDRGRNVGLLMDGCKGTVRGGRVFLSVCGVFGCSYTLILTGKEK